MVQILSIHFQMLNFWTFEPSNKTEFYFWWQKNMFSFLCPSTNALRSCQHFTGRLANQPRLALQSGDTTRVEAEF